MAYNGIVLFDDVKYNYLVVKKGSATQEELTNFKKPDYVPKWEEVSRAMILANFDNTLVSSYISGLPKQFDSWAVYRQKIGDKVQKFVGKVERNRLFIIDYLVGNQTEYIYYVIPETTGEMGVSMQSPIIKTDWWNYSLTGLKQIGDNVYVADKVWLFDFNVVSTEIVQNTDVSVFKTFTRIPKISKGLNNYQTMGISCLLGGVNSATEKYEDDIALLQDWQNFVAEDILCLWKDRKGSIKVGVVTDSPNAKYTDETTEQITTITFNFVETKDIDDISVYNSQDNIISNAYIDVTTSVGQKITVSGIGTKTAKDVVTRFTVLSNTEYTVSVNEKEGYITPKSQLITTGDEGSVTNITFEYKIDPNYKPKETISIEITKTWDDNYDLYAYRPKSITIDLYANGVFKESKDTTSSQDWKCNFTNLDKYDNDNQLITYTVNEGDVEKYTKEITGYTIKNTFQGLTIDTPVTEESAKAFVESDMVRRGYTSNDFSIGNVVDIGNGYYIQVRDPNTSMTILSYTIYSTGKVEIEES